ncbi:MAG TPA: P-loop NTPase fold protein, partial [Tissierellaceae bacterium]
MDRIQWEKFKREYLPLENGQGRENYLFKKQLEKLERLLKNTREEENDEFNKVIGISGERGSGKSSLLWSFKNILDKEVEERRYYALNPIDPNYLDKNMGLLEIILTTLYNEVEKHIKKNKDCDLQQAKQVKDSILRQIELQTNMRQSKGFSSKATPSELIEEYKSRISFQEEYHALFKKCWSLLVGMSCENYKRGYLVILIDDIDIVNNDLIYDMLEDIKMVLSENTTTVLTYRKTQLESSLYNVKIEENRELIDNFSLVDREEVIKQGDTYLEKLIAQNNTVEMETFKDIFERQLKELFTEKEDEKYLEEQGMDPSASVRSNIYQYIEKNILINIESRDYRELESFESSFNLRGIIQLFEKMVEEFQSLDLIQNSEDFTERLNNNILLIKSYFLGKGTDILAKERLNMIARWDEAAPKNKNYLLYSYISQQIAQKIQEDHYENLDAKEIYGKMLNVKSVQYYNICLGDVVEVLAYEKMFTEDHTFHFYIKVLYSIELLTSLVEEIYEVNSTELKLRDHFRNELFQSDEKIEGNIYFTNEKLEKNVNAFYNTTYYQ